ncbi:Protein SHOOT GRAVITROPISM 5 [Ananas comosus]|uniref:Protein SHOOT GRAVITROPISM 5 n=1 Tax=Ananas comosus TaxID=4615 RepID=A0A199V8D4_ANACO|nr:Protein SHOOT GRAVITROPISM 5 [Ananas comosus]
MLSSPSPAPTPPPPPLPLLLSGGVGDASSASPGPPQLFPSSHIAAATAKKKRRPAGTPDPDAEVVSLSPRTLLESDRYVCEICNQGFQRDQNLQMHRRRHKVPWKLLKREGGAGGEGAGAEARKRVFVCPEPSCLHHDPCHALGDLVGIKKHFRRKHSTHRQWVCAKCSKAYAVQSDYKAHLKTCGTRGHSCDCGRVFSRVESFIEHQDACSAGRARARAELQTPPPPPACLSRTGSSPSPSSDTNFSPTTTLATLIMPNRNAATMLRHADQLFPSPRSHNLELQLLPPSTTQQYSARREAKRQIELAEREFADAKRIRHQAQTELDRARAIRDRAVQQINSVLLQITCYACKKHFRAKPVAASDENSSLVATSYVSSVVTQVEAENDDRRQNNNKTKMDPFQ